MCTEEYSKEENRAAGEDLCCYDDPMHMPTVSFLSGTAPSNLDPALN